MPNDFKIIIPVGAGFPRPVGSRRVAGFHRDEFDGKTGYMPVANRIVPTSCNPVLEPFAQEGGIGKVYQLFGEELWGMLEELNEVLAA